MNAIDTRIDEIYEELATLAEAHFEYVGGCLTEAEYQEVCNEADALNQELDTLYAMQEEV
jgi:hypothetical protein